MKIFIRCHAGRLDRGALSDFVGRALRGPWYTGFRKRGEIADCRIVRIMDMPGRRVEYHGLVEVRPARIGWYLIQRLDGKVLRGKPVQVRKWFERSSRLSDRRRPGELETYPDHLDRRGGQDRRRMIRMQLIDDMPAVLARQPVHARH